VEKLRRNRRGEGHYEKTKCPPKIGENKANREEAGHYEKRDALPATQ